tara:strand:+ start:34874 stop:36304 length:1431 start_codon:yes stop_codon:yes gene_type:complete
MKNTIKGNYINGIWRQSESLKAHKIINPANLSEVVGYVQWADNKTVKLTLEYANTAMIVWKKTPLETRIRYANLLLDKIVNHKLEFAHIITSENGKTTKESLSEINASVEESKFHINFLKSNLNEIRGETETRYEPIGVVLTITPWNFPLATIMRKMIPALISGNPVIVKPSEYAPLTAIFLFELIDEIGLPKGVVNLINGSGEEIGFVLLQSDFVKAISFTGSNFTGNKIANLIGGKNIRFQAEMGGSNAVIVLNDADLNIVVPDIISNAFACAGQWCTGTSRVVAEEKVYDELIESLKKYIAKIRIGNGVDKNVDMGPVSNEKQFNSIINIINKAIKQGAKIEIGGETEKFIPLQNYLIEPTILSNITSEMDIDIEEVFGPVLMVYKANDLKHALKIVNNGPYGLSASIYTDNVKKADKFIDEAECGLVHINLPTAFREYSKPLLGWKSSGMGIPECGRFMLDLFTKPKVIYRK